MKEVIETRVEESEWLLEGSKKDEISHFFCRIACSDNADMSEFFLRAETSLFLFRISSMSEQELLQTIKLLKKCHIALRKWSPEALYKDCLDNVFLTLENAILNTSWENIVKDYFSGSKKYFMVPFESVITLVSKRQVYLYNGYAQVPLSKLCDILVPVFQDFLTHGMKIAKMKKLIVNEDLRMKQLIIQLKHCFKKRFPGVHYGLEHWQIRSDDIDNIQHMFPLCMSHLHKRLRQCHRLAHSDRIQYTLYLKEIGLPVHEAINFWREEYSKAGHRTSCHHSWEKDGPRYIYSIRHLYGLEGKRMNYLGHSCSNLLERDIRPSDDGGCPFKQFDESSLLREITSQDISIEFQSEILNLCKNNCFHAACKCYYSAKLSNQCNTQCAKTYSVSENDHESILYTFIDDDKNKAPSFNMKGLTKEMLIDDKQPDFSKRRKLRVDSEGFQNGHLLDVLSDETQAASSIVQYENSSRKEKFSSHKSHPNLFHKPLDYYASYKALIDGLNI